MTNIAELLKDAPKGMKLYSPLFGEVEFKYTNGSKFEIVVEDSEGCCKSFDKYGRYFTTYNNAECLLFPSKDCRTWEGWELPVEPKFKFKVGDWIVHDMSDGRVSPPRQIIALTDKSYILDGECFNSFYFKDLEESFRKWTIADAKDGDVLMTTNIRNCPFIYRKTDCKNNLAYYYAGIDGNGNFCEGCLKRTLYHFGSVSDVAPATKEQRVLLFKKIQEAGYQWYAGKKELRKIQPHYDITNFYAGMPVLVRDFSEENWQYVHFSNYVHYDGGVIKFWACGTPWRQCIPFNGDTKHLLGTTDMCSEEYVNW